MPLYFLVHDYDRFHRLIVPALSESARRRSFDPCRDLATELTPAVAEYRSRYQLSDEPLLTRLDALSFDRRLWTHLAGEALLFGADEVPELQTAPASLGRLIGEEPSRQIHRGSRDLVFGGRTYRPDQAGVNDDDDLAHLAGALLTAEPTSWSPDALAGLPGLETIEDRADELDFVREWFPDLFALYVNADAEGRVIVCEEL
jgi:hypothetical protein